LDTRKTIMIIVGVILLLMGVVFALQGANVITGSSVMSGNSNYIYIGGVVALVGLVLLIWASRKSAPSPSTPANPPK
jgi:protein-S-isoprenylcysteine O-methyltransferase Ste14